MDYTIIVFLDAAGKPTDVVVGDVPNRDESMLDMVTEAMERFAEREPILAMLTTTAYIVGSDTMERFGQKARFSARLAYLAMEG